jgi:DDE family transposase
MMEEVLLAMVEPETAGHPMSEQKWVRSSLRSLRTRLHHAGPPARAPTVSRLLKKHDYALRVNAKEKEARAQHPDRDTQFRYIETQQQTFRASGDPIIRVDTKQKALLGNFTNAGHAGCQEADAVNVHDFLSDALGRGTPYGIFAGQRNAGAIYVGTSADTPEFAVEAIARWWHEHGQAGYPAATRRLILAEAGGSHGCRPHLWKAQGQRHLSAALRLSVTGCHYPTGGSKWNPIEHRLFSQISINGAGKPLRTWETMLGLIRGTTPHTGLTVSAHLLEGIFETGNKVSATVLKTLNMPRHALCPQGNSTMHPRLGTPPTP